VSTVNHRFTDALHPPTSLISAMFQLLLLVLIYSVGSLGSTPSKEANHEHASPVDTILSLQ
jgi:hypothetical protein